MADAGAFLWRFGRHLAAGGEPMVRRIVDRTYAEVPSYGGVPREDLLEATRETTAAAAAAFLQQRSATPGDLAFDVETIRRRIRQGVTSAGWAAHSRVYLEEARAEAERLSARDGIAEPDVLAGVLEILTGAQELLAFANEQFEQAEQELLRRDDERRLAYVTGVLRGTLTPATIRSGAATLGLDPDALYAAVRIRPGTPQLAQRLARAEPTVGARGAWVAVDGEVLGLSLGGVPVAIGPAVAGLGPAAPLEALAGSYAVATSALETAARFRMTGAHRIEDLGALPLVTASGRAADAMLERFVTRVQGSGPSGPALLETVREFLAQGLRPGPTAQAMHLHPNSLRKRLARFEELTGADLGSMDDLVAIWWALRRRELDG